MGRALFSTLYTSPVVVRTEPDVPDQADTPRCEKWSITNPFDPDSAEFYESATRETFIDTDEWRLEQETVRQSLAAQAQGGNESSSPSEANENDAGSPMALGSDDPVLLVTDAYPTTELDASWTPPSPTAGESNNYRSMPGIGRRRSSSVSIGFVPPIILDNSTVALETTVPPSTLPPQSPTLRRAHAIIPISIDEISSPSPTSPASPTTPTDDRYHREIMSMLTPSPVPSVTPHLYTWHHIAPQDVSMSPLTNMSGSAGPLTNPSARMSLARLNVTPVRILAQNAAV
ncbi:hypothetical protein H0H87_004681 [Tephrocybe sp. NHM501043]|nr:hypothetical protein H0H87_004681 [Tephrocybe sp. NHM501043]